MIRHRGITIDRRRRVMNYAGDLHLPPVMFRLASTLLLAGPQSRRTLFDLVYGGDPDGGPLWDSLSVQMNDLQKRLAAVGITLRRERRGGFKNYWAEPAAIEQREAA